MCPAGQQCALPEVVAGVEVAHRLRAFSIILPEDSQTAGPDDVEGVARVAFLEDGGAQIKA